MAATSHFGRPAGYQSKAAKKQAKRKKPKSSPKVTALALTSDLGNGRGRRQAMPSPGPTDLRRWFKVEGLGKSVEEIAAEEKKPVFVVQASLDYMKEWQFRNRTSVLEAKAIEVAMQSLDGVGKVLDQGMKAEKIIHINPKTGKTRKAPDMAMRLKTVAEVRGLIETVQPKAPGLQLNQQFNGGMVNQGFSSGMSFEAVLRKKREQNGMANEQEIETVDAELANGPSIEDEFAEFGGDDGEEDDDEETGEEGEDGTDAA